MDFAGGTGARKGFDFEIPEIAALNSSSSDFIFDYENEDDDEDDLLTKQPRLMAEKGLIKFARASHFSPALAGAGIGTWSLKNALQPVAVASSGQSLSHSA